MSSRLEGLYRARGSGHANYWQKRSEMIDDVQPQQAHLRRGIRDVAVLGVLESVIHSNRY